MTEITALLSSTAPGAIRAPGGATPSFDFALLLGTSPEAVVTMRQAPAGSGNDLPAMTPPIDAVELPAIAQAGDAVRTSIVDLPVPSSPATAQAIAPEGHGTREAGAAPAAAVTLPLAQALLLTDAGEAPLLPDGETEAVQSVPPRALLSPLVVLPGLRQFVRPVRRDIPPTAPRCLPIEGKEAPVEEGATDTAPSEAIALPAAAEGSRDGDSRVEDRSSGASGPDIAPTPPLPLPLLSGETPPIAPAADDLSTPVVDAAIRPAGAASLPLSTPMADVAGDAEPTTAAPAPAKTSMSAEGQPVADAVERPAPAQAPRLPNPSTPATVLPAAMPLPSQAPPPPEMARQAVGLAAAPPVRVPSVRAGAPATDDGASFARGGQPMIAPHPPTAPAVASAPVPGRVAETAAPVPIAPPEAARAGARAASAGEAAAPPVSPALQPRAEPVILPAAQAFAGALFLASEPPAAKGLSIEAMASVEPAVAGLDLAAARSDTARPALAAAAASAPLDMSGGEWMEGMIDRIEMLSATRTGGEVRETRIRLNPDSLGSLEIAIEREGETTNLRFTAETSATRSLLAEAAPRLAELADARGLRLGQTSVDLGSSAQGAPHQQQGHGQRQDRPDQGANGNRLPAFSEPAARTAAADQPDRIA